MTLIQLALGFVVANPAVTAALIGPRTPEQLDRCWRLPMCVLPADVLAAIDAIVAPGLTVNPGRQRLTSAGGSIAEPVAE